MRWLHTRTSNVTVIGGWHAALDESGRRTELAVRRRRTGRSRPAERGVAGAPSPRDSGEPLADFGGVVCYRGGFTLGSETPGRPRTGANWK